MSKQDDGLLGLAGTVARHKSYGKPPIMSNTHTNSIDAELYGEGLLGEPLAPKRTGNMAEKFLVPPFSVLSAREGWWQNRKRMWLALGIKSELGRGGELTWQGEIAQDLDHSGAGNDLDPVLQIKTTTKAPSDMVPSASTALPVASYQPLAPLHIAAKPLTAPVHAPEPPALPQAPVTVIAPPARRVAPPVSLNAAVAAARTPAQPITLSVPTASASRSYENPFLFAHAERLRTAGTAPLTFDEATWDHAARTAVGIDVEVFRNFLVICFKRFADGKRLAFERSERRDLDKEAVAEILRRNVIVSFNGTAYDLPIVALILDGADCSRVKDASDQLIRDRIKPWEIERELGVGVPRINHVDLMEPNPSVRQGLKILNGRLHGRYMVDLPYAPDAILTREQMNVVTLYCHNDLDATELLYRAMREPLEMRVALGKRYGMDLRSKSDSQIGEAIVRKRAEALTGGRRLGRPSPTPETFAYEPPDFIRFKGARMRGILDDIYAATFTADGIGNIAEPAVLQGLTVTIGDSIYAMGIGGLHSTEAHRALRSDNERVLIDVDVASQYPNIIRKLGLYPSALGPAFITAYGEIIDERIAAKGKMQEIELQLKENASDELKKEREQWKVRSDSQKIVLNGQFGKLGSHYSILYSPRLLIATTLTGQLSMLMLIERAEDAGIPVVSANTDGVIFHCPRSNEMMLDGILGAWEAETGFQIERTRYVALYSSSVNTYIAVREDGKIKRKGPIADPWAEGDLRGQMMKNPQMTVCAQAAERFLVTGTPIEETVRNCTDPRAFVGVINAKAGATWRSVPLGRAIRYYWSTDSDPIMTDDGNRRVAKTEGAKPLMELTDALPDDLDYARYCAEAARLVVDLGVDSMKLI